MFSLKISKSCYFPGLYKKFINSDLRFSFHSQKDDAELFHVCEGKINFLCFKQKLVKQVIANRVKNH